MDLTVVFDHVLSWEEHKHDKNILTMFYEEMKKDLSKSIKKITTFLNINMSDDEIDKIAWKTSFSEMKNNAAKENSDSNHTICALTCNRNLVFRKELAGAPPLRCCGNAFTVRFHDVFSPVTMEFFPPSAWNGQEWSGVEFPSPIWEMVMKHSVVSTE
ncbi:Bile salt sulfotransferase [Manis javanica]|nr:Bile salt sulfotransferase [Manis javanica]